jgi:DNA-binding NtrC family response regulator
MTSSPIPALQPQLSPLLGSGKCVILVDDETAYIDLLEQLLGEHLACPVHSFTRATDALAALPRLDVGLIVTDFHMPGLNGLEFLSEVQRARPGIPAVMITAHDITFSDDVTRRAPTLKAIVRKPFKWVTLAEQISLFWSGSTPPFPLR